MRERAVMIGARLSVDNRPEGGLEVRLALPVAS
jgi:signal transduction histidine kinase